MRALVILWTLALHTAYGLAFHVPRSRWLAVSNSLAYRWILRGELAVDGFFVLSGYLIAYYLIAEYRDQKTIAIGHFYIHRFLRLSPLLWAVLLANRWIAGDISPLWWTNVLYINNFVPYERQFLSWGWSLAVEEQFYILFPATLLLLYRWRRFRLSTLIALLALAFALRALVILRHGIHLPLALVESVTGPGATPWALYADAVYVKPYTRFGALLCGILVAYLRHYTSVDAALRRRPVLSTALLLSSCGLLALVVAAPMHDLQQAWSPVASLLYLTAHPYLAGLSTACLMLVSLSPAGLAKPFARFLSWRLWYPLAVTAYASYLVQPIVIEQGYYHLEKYLRDHDVSIPPISPGIYVALFAGAGLATFLVSALLFVFVEKPFMNLRRRPLSQTPVPPRASPGETQMVRISHPKLAVLATASVLLWAAAAESADTPLRSRKFQFDYTSKVDEIPAEASKLEMWVPYPQSDEHQVVSEIRVDAPARTEILKDPVTGNAMVHLVIERPQQPVEVKLSFVVDRQEHVHKDFPRSGGMECPTFRPEIARWLKAEKLVPLNERIQELSKQVTEGKKTDLERARAIYDYVVQIMSYDKSGTGWGNGDIYWACDAKRGNCTDFHALFIGLVRAAGIPARFEIGFPVPPEKGQGEIGGYHCWAEFYLAGYGWVPVDASEAKKHLEKKEYFFGALDENRVQLTVGRDLQLTPRQAGEPLNYFVYPYVEIDGKPHKGLTKKFAYRDLDAAPTPSR